VLADLLARSFRIRWLLGGLGARIRFRDAFTLNTFGEAGCALTPLRLGGEPSRLAGMLGAGVPLGTAITGIAIEVLTAWPVIISVAVVLAVCFAPTWWRDAWPEFRLALVAAWPWLLAVLVATLIAVWIASRWAELFGRVVKRPLNEMAQHWRGLPRSVLIATAPCTLINVVSRTALLPVLACTLPTHPPLGVLLLGSFGLLYSQLFLPTPAGLGAVDLGLLAGAAGNLGAGETGVLLAWRFYSVGLGAGLGLLLALRIYGWSALRRLLRFDSSTGG
jgi:lysylphosphatidylglycerol synthase-like protein